MTPELIAAAYARLEPVVRRTPLLESPGLNALAGRRVLVKAECLQHTGSFKFRGGWAAVTGLTDAQRARGVVAFSSGNHAQGVARAAAANGVTAVIIMPQDAPNAKIANTRALGAEVILYDRSSGADTREIIGAELVQSRGLTLIPPYDDPVVIAGQASTGIELAEQAHEAGVGAADVLVCCGGGGLSSGIALALEERAPALRVRPCEPEGFDDMTRSLALGRPVANAALSGSICDAILTNAPGKLTWPILQRLAGPGLVVSDAECLGAMRAAFEHLRIVVEPGGAAALAAALAGGEGLPGDGPVIVVATGGNVDPAVFVRTLAG